MERYREIGERAPQESERSLRAEKDEAVSAEIDLALADRLIERLEALDELTPADLDEAQGMVEELDQKRRGLMDKNMAVPDALVYTIGGLRTLLLGATRSVREEYARREESPEVASAVLAEAGKLELELIERQAAGTLMNDASELQERIADLLPRLERIQGKDDDMQTILDTQRTMLRKFLRLTSES